MLPFLRILFLFFAMSGIVTGFLMLVAPTKYPKLYAGFLSGSLMQRQHTERDKGLAIRTQGLIALTVGTLFAFFIWAVL